MFYRIFLGCLFLLLVGCTIDSMPRTADGQDPDVIPAPKNKSILVDMGYVVGDINGKKLHAYRVVYNSGLGTSADHIYILENGNQISVNQPEGKTRKDISVIVEGDTFRLYQAEKSN